MKLKFPCGNCFAKGYITRPILSKRIEEILDCRTCKTKGYVWIAIRDLRKNKKKKIKIHRHSFYDYKQR